MLIKSNIKANHISVKHNLHLDRA